MQKIKIAFIIDTIENRIGGTERQLILLLKHLDKSRFEPYLCCFKDSSWLRDNAHLFNIHVFRFNSFFSPKDYFNLLNYSRFLKNERIDIVQTHFRDGNILGIIAAKLAGIKTIISARRNKGYWHNKKELAVLRLLNLAVTRFLANSEAVRSHVHNIEGISEEKIEVIYNGYEASIYPENFTDRKRHYRLMLGIHSDTPVIVNVSNLRPVKGLDVFLRAAQTVVSRYPDTIFLILGDGPNKASLQRLADELGITNNVNFLGTRNDVHDILAVCDIGVLSSHSEGLSNSIIEYMAAGLPVVCTDVGGNSELIEDNKNGFLTHKNDYKEMAEAILKLLDNPAMKQEMGKISMKKANFQFNIKNFIDNTEKFYENLISGE